MAFSTEYAVEREILDFLKTISHIGRGKLTMQIAIRYNIQITNADMLINEMIRKGLIEQSADDFIRFGRHHVVSDLY